MKVAIYGCSPKGIEICKELKTKRDIEQIIFIERDVSKIGTIVEGAKVVSIYLFESIYRNAEVDKIIVPNYSVNATKTMKAELRMIHVKAEDVLIVEYQNFINMLQQMKCFADYSNDKLPYLQYISYEAAGKCNLNCKRCDHFSNLLKEENSQSYEDFEQDIKQLHNKIESIGLFSFLGGEPLLNNDLDKLLLVFNRYYPNTKTVILTNGLLLKVMPDKLVEAILETNTTVRMTLYPPLKSKIDELIIFMRNKGIPFETSKVADEFWTQINVKGDSDAMKMLNRCVNSDCVVLKEGKLAKCPICMNSDIFNSYFDENLPKEIIDLYDDNLTVEQMHNYFYNPIATCRYCGLEKFYLWERTEGKVNVEEMLCLQSIQ